jgi:hypothetical protein
VILAKIRNIDLSDLTSQFKDFSKVLGPEEIRILSDADLLLHVTIPHDEPGKLAYLSKSAQIQSKLNNLLSRLSYVFNMTTIDRDSHLGDLIESKEIEGRDRRYLGLVRDPKFRDLEETVAALEVIKDHVNNTLWILKTVMGRL